MMTVKWCPSSPRPPLYTGVCFNTRQWLLVWIDATDIFHFPCFKNHFLLKIQIKYIYIYSYYTH